MIDAEKRKGGQEPGLETQLPLSVNDEWQSVADKQLDGEVNTKTIPPCEYGRKSENKKISRSRSKRSEACYLIR